jgi:hypothetical protein
LGLSAISGIHWGSCNESPVGKYRLCIHLSIQLRQGILVIPSP